MGTRIRQPRKLAPDCAGLLEALYFLAYCWAETCERRRLCLRGSVLLLPAPGAGPAAAPRARTQLCKHEGAVSTVSLVSPSPVFPVTMVPVSPPIASLSCQAARWGRCGPAAAEYLLSKLPPLQYLDISQNIFYVKNIFVYFHYRAARSEPGPGPGPGQPGRVPELPLSPPAGGFRGQILIILVRRWSRSRLLRHVTRVIGTWRHVAKR